MLEEFKASLERNGVRVPDEYWSRDQDKLALRLRIELTDLVDGLDKGEELATRGDPQVREAAGLFPRVQQILERH